jgi:hypothetical protein
MKDEGCRMQDAGCRMKEFLFFHQIGSMKDDVFEWKCLS